MFFKKTNYILLIFVKIKSLNYPIKDLIADNIKLIAKINP